MSISKSDRRSIHKKQERSQIKSGAPSVGDLREGVTVFRFNNKLTQYVKHKGILYTSEWNKFGAPTPKTTPASAVSEASIHRVDWYDMVLEDDWEAFSDDYFTPSYCKDVNGFVHLRGKVKDGDAVSDITSLPVGYRPSKKVILIGVTFGGASDEAAQCRVNIEVDGDVHGSSGAVGDGAMNPDWVSLEGLLFFAG